MQYRLPSLVLLLLLGSLSLPARLSAQAPVAVLLRTEAGDGVGDGTVRGFDRVLRERLSSLEVVRIEGSVELDLEQVQLALGCIGESEACLRAVADETGGGVLVFASVERVAPSFVVSVQRFDTATGTLRRAVRTVDSEAGVLEAAEPAVRELWDLPPIPEADGPDRPGTASPPARSLSPWPPVLIGLGGAALVGGAIALGLGFADRDAYVAARPTSDAEVDAALARLSAAQAELLAGSILLSAGAVLAVAGTGWLLGAGNEDGSSPLAIVPLLSPDGVLVLASGVLPGGAL